MGAAAGSCLGLRLAWRTPILLRLLATHCAIRQPLPKAVAASAATSPPAAARQGRPPDAERGGRRLLQQPAGRRRRPGRAAELAGCVHAGMQAGHAGRAHVDSYQVLAGWRVQLAGRLPTSHAALRAALIHLLPRPQISPAALAAAPAAAARTPAARAPPRSRWTRGRAWRSRSSATRSPSPRPPSTGGTTRRASTRSSSGSASSRCARRSGTLAGGAACVHAAAAGTALRCM